MEGDHRPGRVRPVVHAREDRAARRRGLRARWRGLDRRGAGDRAAEPHPAGRDDLEGAPILVPVRARLRRRAARGCASSSTIRAWLALPAARSESCGGDLLGGVLDALAARPARRLAHQLREAAATLDNWTAPARHPLERAGQRLGARWSDRRLHRLAAHMRRAEPATPPAAELNRIYRDHIRLTVPPSEQTDRWPRPSWRASSTGSRWNTCAPTPTRSSGCGRRSPTLPSSDDLVHPVDGLELKAKAGSTGSATTVSPARCSAIEPPRFIRFIGPELDDRRARRLLPVPAVRAGRGRNADALHPALRAGRRLRRGRGRPGR